MHAPETLITLGCLAAVLINKCYGQDVGLDRAQESPSSIKDMVDQGWFPGQARLASFGRDNFNSVLVGEGWVLTAASIFRNNYNPYVWSAWVVARDAFNPGGEQTTHHVQNTFLHGGYKEGGHQNDLALVRLQWTRSAMPDLNLQTRGKFAPVSLPIPGQLSEDQICYLIGWNQTKTGAPSPRDLRTNPVSLWNDSRCNQELGAGSVSPGHLCLASSNMGDGPCQGDQGSPVLCPYGNSWAVVGVVSRLFGCRTTGETTTTRVGTFTDVSYYLPWINKIMRTFESNV